MAFVLLNPVCWKYTTNKRLMEWLVANNSLQSQVKEKRRRTHGKWKTKVDRLLLLITKKWEGRRFPPSLFPHKRIQQDIKSSAKTHQSFPWGTEALLLATPRQGESECGPISFRVTQHGRVQSQTSFRLSRKASF